MAIDPRLLAAVCVMACIACGSPSDPLPTGDIAHRWIKEEPGHLLESTDLYRLDPIFQWTFNEPQDLEQWTLHGLKDPAIVDGRLRAVVDRNDPQLARATDLDPSELHELEVELIGTRKSNAVLFWAGPKDRFSSQRSMEGKATRSLGEPHTTLRFNLQDHARFRGPVARVRIDPQLTTGTTLQIVRITGLRRTVDTDRVAEACRRAWKVDLDSDARNALLAPPGLKIDQRIMVPEGAVLSVAYGLLPGVEPSVRFKIGVSADGEDFNTLFSRSIDGSDAGRWLETSVSLDQFAGRTISVRLETSTPEPFDLTQGVPVWANPELTSARRETGPNVVLICLDTLRADRLSAYGHHLPTSPWVDAWAGESATVFRQVVATAPWTLPSHVSMFTGLDAMRHGVNHYGAAPSSLEMVAETLRRAGYATAAVTGGGYLRPQFGLAQGFDRFSYWPHKESERELATGTDMALRWLDDHHQQPFFLFFHTYEVHFPHRKRQPYFSDLAAIAGFRPPDVRISMRAHDWKDLIAPGDYLVVQRPGSNEWVAPLNEREKMLANLMYDSAVSYADAHVQKIIDRLDRYDLRDRTVVILTSDHGEALGEHDRAGHSFLEDYNVLVPLIIEMPGGTGAGTVVDRQVRLTDLTPTILEATGTYAVTRMDGVSLLPLVDGRPSQVPDDAWTYSASNNRGIALRSDNQLKFTLVNAAWSQIAGQASLFDLETDPNEETDLVADDARVPQLKARTTAALLEQHTGFRLTISNAGPHTLKARLEGAFASHARLKTADPDCGCVHWRKGERPTISLPPGQRVRLQLETPEKPHMGLTLWIVNPDGTRGHRTRHRFEIAEVVPPVAWSFVDLNWRRLEDPSEAPETGFRLSWQGERPAAESTDPGDDAAMVEQLRALGYVQ